MAWMHYTHQANVRNKCRPCRVFRIQKMGTSVQFQAYENYPKNDSFSKKHNNIKECLQQLTWDLTATCVCFSMQNICTFCTQMDVLVPWIWGTQGLWFLWPTNSHAKQRTCTAQQIPVFVFPPWQQGQGVRALVLLTGLFMQKLFSRGCFHKV